MPLDYKLETSNLINPLILLIGEFSDEYKNFVKTGLEPYLMNQVGKYLYAPNFLFRFDRVNFFEHYFPIKVSSDKLKSNFKSIRDIFDEASFISIIGSAGSGKTTLMKYIFLQCIKQQYKIPIIVELRKLNKNKSSLEEYIKSKISHTNPNDRILIRSLKEGKYLFLFDGYDEVFSVNKAEVDEQIEQFSDQYFQNTFVISSRPNSGIEWFSRFLPLKVQELSTTEIRPFIKRVTRDEELAGRIHKNIQRPESKIFKSYLKNPLLLSMFVSTFRKYPELPGRKSTFYRNVFDTLYSQHDSFSKTNFVREKKSNLKYHEFEQVINGLAYVSLFNGQYTFSRRELSSILGKVINKLGFECETNDLIHDLVVPLPILIEDGNDFSFPHKSLQEFFCANFINSCESNRRAVIYRKYAEILERSSNDLSFNFWDLNSELNYFEFTNDFLIVNLNKFLLRINDGINGINILALLSEFNWSLFVEPEFAQKERLIYLKRRPSLIEALVKYVGFEKDLFDLLFDENSVIEDLHGLLIDSLKENYEIIDRTNIKRVWSSDIQEAFEKSRFMDNCQLFLANLLVKISELNNTIISDQESIDDLIDMI